MSVVFRWLRLVFSGIFFIASMVAVFNYQTTLYLISQAKGQLVVLTSAQSVKDSCLVNRLTPHQRENLQLVERIKNYSVDKLGYLPTDNYTTVFVPTEDQILWVITSCEAYEFDAYQWSFPIVGKVSYKGFFRKELAEREYNHLVSMGYDVDLRSVSAWSTLGWFKDPLIMNMLDRSKAGLCNLLFHELFHSTYYAPNSVNLNENLANFVAHKATLEFLKEDTAAIRSYLYNQEDNNVFSRYMLMKKNYLASYYKHIKNSTEKQNLKLKALYTIVDSIQFLPLHNPKKFTGRGKEIMKFKNAYFIDFQQYESLQDSLENVFNKFYAGNLKIFIERLKLNKINY